MTEFKVLLNGKSYIEYVWNEKQGKLTQSFKSAQATEDGFDLDFSKPVSTYSPLVGPTEITTPQDPMEFALWLEDWANTQGREGRKGFKVVCSGLPHVPPPEPNVKY